MQRVTRWQTRVAFSARGVVPRRLRKLGMTIRVGKKKPGGK